MGDESDGGGSGATGAGLPSVLLIEDDVTSASRLGQLLAEDGYVVEWLRDGRAALARISEGAKPDVILMDYKLPHEDGFALARKARARWANVPIVFVTSYPEVVSREPAMDPPATLVSKPVAYDELVAAMGALVVRR